MGHPRNPFFASLPPTHGPCRPPARARGEAPTSPSAAEVLRAAGLEAADGLADGPQLAPVSGWKGLRSQDCKGSRIGVRDRQVVG